MIVMIMIHAMLVMTSLMMIFRKDNYVSYTLVKYKQLNQIPLSFTNTQGPSLNDDHKNCPKDDDLDDGCAGCWMLDVFRTCDQAE